MVSDFRGGDGMKDELIKCIAFALLPLVLAACAVLAGY